MLIDKSLIFSDGQDVTTDAASDSYIDLKTVGRSIPELYLVVQVAKTFDSSSDTGTLAIKLQSHEDSSFSTGTIDVFTSQTFAQSDLTAGSVLLKMRLPEITEQYIQLYYDNGTEAFTDGLIDAFLTDNVNLY